MLQENQWVTTSSAGGNSASDHLPVLTLTGIVCVGLLLVIPTIAQNPLAAFSSREGVSLDPRHGLLTWRYQTVCDCRDGASNFRSNCPPEIQVHVQQLRCPLGDQRQRSKGLLQKTSEPDEDEVHNPDVGLLPMLQHLAPFGFPGADGFHGQGEVNENEGAVGVLSTLGPGLSGAKDTVSRPYEYIPFAKTHQDETDVHQHYKIHRDRRAAGDTGPTPTVTPTPLWVVYPSYAGWLWSQILRSGAWPQQRSSPLAASRVQQNPLPHADGRVWSQPSLQDQGAQSRRKGVPLADGDVSGSVNTNSFFAGLSAVERLVLQNAVPAVGAPFLDGTWQTRNQPRRNTGQTEQTGRNLRQHPQKAWNSGQNGQTGRNFGQQGQTGRNEENQGQSGRILGQQEQMGRILGNQGQSGRILGQQEQMGRILGQRGQTGRNAQNQGQTGRILRQQGQTGRNTGNLGQAGRNFGQGQTGPNFGQARPNVRQQGQTNGLSQPQPANGSGRGGQAVRAPLTAAAWVIPVYPGQGVWIRAGK